MPSLICPVATPQDESEIRKVIRHVAANGKGPNKIFILGTTGEFYALSISDKKSLIGIAVDEITSYNKTVDAAKEGMPLELAVGITGENLEETIGLAQYAEDKGVRSGVLMPGYITTKNNGCFTRRGITGNVMAVLENTKKIMLMLYNHPDRTGKNIRTQTWKKLSRHPRIAALKDSSGDPKRSKNYHKAADGYAMVYVGNEIQGLTEPLDGTVAGFSNVLPVAWQIAVHGGQELENVAINVIPILVGYQKVYAQNPIGAFKYMLNKLGVISSDRTFDPKLELSKEQKRNLDNIMSDKSFEAMYAWGT